MAKWVILGLNHELDEWDRKGIDELNELLESLGINFETKVKDGAKLLEITYDPDLIKKKLNRNAGAKPKFMDHTVSVNEIRERMKNESAEEIARSLGVSRSTLFRRLKDAEETGLDYIL